MKADDIESRVAPWDNYSASLDYLWNPFLRGFTAFSEYLWSRWATKVADLPLYTRMPWSGDVEQCIRAWGMAIGQIVSQKGLVNLSCQNSSANPGAEVFITEEVATYGRQLGRILDVLAPLVKENKDTLFKKVNEKERKDFEDMADKIKAAVEVMNKARPK